MRNIVFNCLLTKRFMLVNHESSFQIHIDSYKLKNIK